MTPERLRWIQRGLGYLGFFVLVFLLALVVSFPYEGAKEKVISLLAAQNYDVEIGKAGPTFGIGMTMKDIAVKTRPPAPQKPSRFFIDWARVRVPFLAAITGGNEVNVTAAVFGGRIDVDRRLAKKEAEFHVKATEINAADLPFVKEAINLPLGGQIELLADLVMQNLKYAETKGAIELKCTGCVLGDGKEKLKIAGNPMLAAGLTLPKIRFGDIDAKIDFEKGTGKLVGVQAKSPDGEIIVEGEIQLRDPLPYSTFRLYIRFKISEALVKSSDGVQIMLQLGEATGKRPDGFYGMAMTGSFARMDPPQWSKSSTVGGSSPTRGPARVNTPPATAPLAPPARPALEAAPESPPPAPSPTIEPAPPPVPPPAPAPEPSPSPAEPVRATPPGPAPAGSIIAEPIRHTIPTPPPAPAEEDDE